MTKPEIRMIFTGNPRKEDYTLDIGTDDYREYSNCIFDYLQWYGQVVVSKIRRKKPEPFTANEVKRIWDFFVYGMIECGYPLQRKVTKEGSLIITYLNNKVPFGLETYIQQREVLEPSEVKYFYAKSTVRLYQKLIDEITNIQALRNLAKGIMNTNDEDER